MKEIERLNLYGEFRLKKVAWWFLQAYDASRLRISEVSDDRSDKYMYSVASETLGVRVQRAVDPEVAALLDDGDLSRFGSDVEDLEEDFVIQANISNDNEGLSAENGLNLDENIESEYVVVDDYSFEEPQIVAGLSSQGGVGYHVTEAKNDSAAEKPRERRLLDEQFDLVSPLPLCFCYFHLFIAKILSLV